MPTFHLTVDDSGGAELLATAGGNIYLPQYRSAAWVNLGRDPVMQWAIIDTGAPACILPSRLWTPLAAHGDIAWLTDSPARFAGSGRVASTTMAGGSYTYRLGRVRLAFSYGNLAPREVLAICTDDPPTAPAHLRLPLVIGLADVMHGRTLRLEASADGQRWAATLSEP